MASTWPFPHGSPYSTGQRINVRNPQLLSLFIPFMHSGAGEITTGWVWGPTRPTVRGM